VFPEFFPRSNEGDFEMKHISAHTAQKDFNGLMDSVTTYNEPVTIVSDDDRSVVLLSMEEWNSIQETIYLQSIPGMVESIKTAASEPLEDGVTASEVDFGV
jgi:prevent-host-death family protein